MKNFIVITMVGLVAGAVFSDPEPQDKGPHAAVQTAVAVLPEKQLELARIAFDRGEYTEALQHLAQVALTNSRDFDQMPDAVFLEGLIYQKTGQTEAAAYVADELKFGWPESVWSRRAAELNGSKTE
jgi:Flp pilus assembly protein TadD